MLSMPRMKAKITKKDMRPMRLQFLGRLIEEVKEGVQEVARSRRIFNSESGTALPRIESGSLPSPKPRSRARPPRLGLRGGIR